VEAVGTNHMSWIKTLRLDGEDFFPKLDARLAKPLDFDAMHPQGMRAHFEYTFPKMVEAYRKFDAFLFSTEGDGMPHLFYYDEAVELSRAAAARPHDPNAQNSRAQEIARFIALSKETLTPEQWDDPMLKTEDPKVATANLVIKGLAGTKPIETTISYSNNGAVVGFLDDDVTEYTAVLQAGKITPKGPHKLPPGTHGVTQSLVECQMLTADAIINENERTFIQSVYAYPPCRESKNVDSFYEEMVACNRAELPKWIA
jgi:alpha-galactosidase/6-phospho-beta-glucosidase family protein